MAAPTTLQRGFARGNRRDEPRNAMVNGSCWTAIDLIPNLGAPLRERGGWSYGSDSITAAKATASYVIGGIFAPYVAGSCNVVVDEDGEVYKVTTGNTVTDVAAGVVVAQNPVMHRDKVIIPASGGSTAPKKVTNAAGTLTVAALGGTPPNGQFATVWSDYTLLANYSTNYGRIAFSGAGDPETWDTTNAVVDMTLPITGLAAMRSSILIFHDEAISRLRGTTPPPGSDFFADDPLFSVGTPDARSIAQRGDRVVFQNGEGIFMTDGSADPVDLTRLCGMSSYWLSLLSSYSKSTWTLVGGFEYGRYFYCVMDGSTFKDAGYIDIDRLAWWRLSNVDARCMWSAQGTSDELYFGRRSAARVGKLSSIFMPAAAVKADADAVAVTSSFESAYYEGEFGAKTLRSIYIDHELTDYASDNPTAALSYIKTPEATSYTALSTGLSESTTKTTTKSRVGGAVDGFAVKLTRSGNGDFKLYGIEAEIAEREKSRRAA